jgi:cysteine desulfurase
VTLYYFDHAASAPRRPEVLAAMEPWLVGVVGNPAGTHRAARLARRAIEDARDEVARFVGADPSGVVFTGGGSESCHLAIAGAVRRFKRHFGSGSIITSPVEHQVILASAQALVDDGVAETWRMPTVDADGVVELDALGALLDDGVAVVSVMTANNETGVIQPINAIGDAVHTSSDRALVHTDAIAAAPWLDLADATASVDLVSLCAHKLGGPVNAGALVRRGRADVDPIVGGGGQEQGRRGGTVDVAAAVGLAAALRACAAERVAATASTGERQLRLERALVELPGLAITASTAARLPGHVHVTVEGAASDELLFLLDQDGVCASAAASCSSGSGIASHVLAAMAMPAARARGAVRFTLGAETTDEDVAALVASLSRAITQLGVGVGSSRLAD